LGLPGESLGRPTMHNEITVYRGAHPANPILAKKNIYK